MSEFFFKHLDYLLFAAACVAGGVALHRWVWWKTGLALLGWLVMAVILIAGWFSTNAAGKREQGRLQRMVEGYAPTYAQELARLGHQAITPTTSPDDPQYSQMIEAEKRWLAANRSIADIYTMRRLPDGTVIMVVDSETDYDHNGSIEGEREQRTPIGEEYKEAFAALTRMYETGEPCFEEEIYTDRWGTWVSAVVPMRGKNGEIEAALAVDFDAAAWAAAMQRARLTTIAYFALLLLLAGAGSGVAAHQVAMRDRLAEQREREVLREANEALEARVQARTAELAELNKKVAITARQAGMAEVANSVLHNVGNVLNSVNVSAATVLEKLRDSRLANLPAATALMQEHAHDLGDFLTHDPQGQQLPGFLQLLGGHWQTEQETLLKEIGDLSSHIQHISEIVQRQQSVSGVSGVIETVSVSEAVEDALALNGNLLKDQGISLRREDAPGLTVRADKSKLVQILVNLLRNAADALVESGTRQREIILRAAVPRGDRLHLQVIDNGPGVAPENLTRIFSHGFTTKKTGHGFGLHGSALAAAEMGGALRVHSDGPGCGATFTIELPPAEPEPFQKAA